MLDIIIQGGEVVTHMINGNNGAGTYNDDYWTVTDRTGTTYSFGLNELPGYKSGDPTTNSVQYEPVYSAHVGDPCYNTAGFTQSVCTMAYRWNLDYVKDAHGNAMAYYYDRSMNAYAQDGNTTSAVPYVRDAYLDHIDYGATASYQSVAAAVNNPKAVRAVGTACATNPLPVVIPCHRVIRSDGQLGAYLGGPEIKHQLLEMESLR